MLVRRALIQSKPYLRHRQVIIRTFYDAQTRDDTIFAPATSVDPLKGSPLAVIRISGPRTEHVIKQLTSKQGSDGASRDSRRCFEPRKATLTRFFSPETDELLDIGLVIWFPAPNSYTGEDVSELHLHGSKAIVTKTLDVLGRMPKLRPAEPGEFSRRAVANGKLSLIQAESLPDLISAQTDQQRQLALRGLSGATRKKYEVWSEQLTRILAHLEASIDFGEDELLGEDRVVNECINKIRRLSQDLAEFIRITSRCRELVRAGAKATILGPPNAGKSTFMNILCGREKSIVSDLSGTTRDVVEHSMELGGHVVTLCDTAGLKKQEESSLDRGGDQSNAILERHGLIEREGIKKALSSARLADLILYLVDGSRLNEGPDWQTGLSHLAEDVAMNLRLGLDGSDASGLELEEEKEESNQKRVRIVINKIDKTSDEIIGREKCVKDYLIGALRRTLVGDNSLGLKTRPVLDVDFISCKTGENLSELVKSIQHDFDVILAPGKQSNQFDFVNERHASLLSSSRRHLELAGGLDLARIDEMAQHVRESVDYLSRISGRVTNDQVLDIVFRDFCIGK